MAESSYGVVVCPRVFAGYDNLMRVAPPALAANFSAIARRSLVTRLHHESRQRTNGLGLLVPLLCYFLPRRAHSPCRYHLRPFRQFQLTPEINRPKSLNAFSSEYSPPRSSGMYWLTRRLIRQAAAVFKKIDEDTSVRAVILSGKGRCFSAGLDRT
jgi:hypothetical protein